MNEEGTLIRMVPDLSGCDLTVDDMDLEVAVRNALKRSGIHTLAQLLELSRPELLQIFPNRKLRSYEDVVHGLIRLSEEKGSASGAAKRGEHSNRLGGQRYGQ